MPKIILFILLSNFISYSTQAAPISAFYGVGPSHIDVIRNGKISNTWTTQNYGEYLVAVSDNSVRTASPISGMANGKGSEYTLEGIPTGKIFNNVTSGLFVDGTTDGRFNYSVDYFSGTVYRANQDWSEATPLFKTGREGLDAGITYDKGENVLWILGYNDTSLRSYSLSGSIIDSFELPNAYNSALAFDNYDGSLWMATQGELGMLSKYSRKGQLLEKIQIDGSSQFWWAGEIGENSTSIPEPDSTSLIMLALAVLMMSRFFRKQRL